jgi:hypothetical protein
VGRLPGPDDDVSFDGATRVWLDREQWSPFGTSRGRRLLEAMVEVLPDGVTVCFNYEGDQVWFEASQGADTNEVYANALRLLEERGETP